MYRHLSAQPPAALRADAQPYARRSSPCGQRSCPLQPIAEGRVYRMGREGEAGSRSTARSMTPLR